MNEECTRFMEDPDAHRDHAVSCADCRVFLEEEAAIERGLSGVQSEPLRPIAASVTSSLPMAPWEGAAHRSWRVAVIGLIIVCGLAAAAFMYGGVSPVAGFVSAARETIASQMSWIAVVRVLPRLLYQAPVPFHLFVAAGFIAANLMLYFLLRRSPKGYDAATR